MLQAVRREVFEEVGIRVSDVTIVGSQPWPIGRGGSCELMIGTVAKAQANDIALNTDEVRFPLSAATDLQEFCLCKWRVINVATTLLCTPCTHLHFVNSPASRERRPYDEVISQVALVHHR